MMVTSDPSHLINSRAQWHHAHLTIPVTILNARTSYGRVDILIRPVGGTGCRWVRLDAVQDIEKEAEVSL